MKDFVSKHRDLLGYILYALILTTALLYFRFPSDAVEDYFRAQGDRANPRLALSVDHIGPLIPYGLKFVKTRVSLRDSPNSLILKADHLSLRPSLLSLLGGKPDYSFHCAAYKGDTSGSIRRWQDETTRSIDTEIELTNVDLGEYAYLRELIGRTVKGTLNGTIVYNGKYKPRIDGSGEANLSLSEGTVELAEPFLTLKSIDFDELEIDMVLNKQKIDVGRLEFKGKQLQGSLSGTITLKKALAESVLRLSGTIEPFAALFESAAGIQDTVAFLRDRIDQGTFTFIIEGTLGKPQIKFT
ncbi:MAG: type II secretion system protein GspN [Deltaproteobacteria bacterium]|nr:type II secretion system protein GspN [Deltaproteobacteria bacterium]